jgi:fatty-acyl-CoA synthase
VEPTRTALVWEQGSRTYAELRANVLSLASALRSAGLRSGDRVVTHLFNRGEIFEIYFACAFAGLTIVPASFRASEEELADVLRDVDARFLFTEEELAGCAHAAAAAAGVKASLVELAADAPGPAYEAMLASPAMVQAYPPADPHIVLFSSGTTGKPKGAELTHRGLLNYAIQQAALFPGYDSSMRTLVVPTLFNTGGLHDFTLPTFHVGGTVCILPSRGWRPERMADYIDRWGITHAIVFPTMFQPLLHADSAAPLSMESLQVILTGGEVCPPDLMRRVRERWPEKELIIGYGSTEAGAIALIGNEGIDAKPGSVGRAAPGQVFRIVRADGTVADIGETGEIWTASPTVIRGYWNAPELAAGALSDGWLRTGDLGYVDDDGYLFINGRLKDMIISKGQNIYPAEVEAVLQEHPAVDQCAVVGVPDEEYGEAAVAVVVRAAGHPVTQDELIDFVRDRIASYKKPRDVVFRSALPISVNNKVLKRELAGEITAEFAG